MAGTLGTFQGLPLRSASFVRSRGWGADQSVVEAVVPDGFDVDPPDLGDVGAEQEPPPLDLAPIAATTLSGPVDLATPLRLAPWGWLVLGESIDGLPGQGGQVEQGPWGVVLGPLYVTRVEEVRRSTGDGGPRVVRVLLVDERYFWARGVVPRWSFNRRRADGTTAQDSVKESGALFTRREVAALCAAALPRRPALVHAPAAWDVDRAPIELPRFGAAVVCLGQLVHGAGLLDPCLRLDGTLALHAAGDGQVGYDRDGQGANTEPLPDALVLWKDGAGEGRLSEPSWPEEWALVVGGERVASVAVDDWQPVLLLPPDGRVVPLDEATVRTLTGGRFGLLWLARFVLRPEAYQSNPYLDPDVAELLADQAWRLYRLRGAVVRRKVEEAEKPFADPLLTLGTPVEREPAPGPDAGPVRKDDGPGPNAHLLPLRDRAETDGSGRRLAPLVETYSFAPVHHALKGDPNLALLAEVERQIRNVRGTATAAMGRAIVNDRGGAKKDGRFLLSSDDLFDVADAFEKADRDEAGNLFESAGVSLDEFQRALDRAREIERFRGTPAGDAIADTLKRLTREQLALEEKLGAPPGRDELFDAAYAVFEAEEQLMETLLGVDPDPNALKEALRDPQYAGVKEAMLLELEELLRRLRSERAEAEERAETTGTAPVEESVGVLRYVNRKRSVDLGARVESESAGVVRTSRLAGHVAPNAVGDLSRATFIPAPVRVVFGAVLRPRLDVPPGGRTASPVTSGADPADDSTDDFRGRVGSAPGGDDVVPAVLSDQETYFTAAFRRDGRARARRAELGDAVLSRAVPLEDKELVELVTLDGESNRAQLDDLAHARARQLFDTPEVVRSRRVLMARAWPVNPDGVVSAVEIRTRFKDGVPCGFETLITSGGDGVAPAEGTTRVRLRAVAQAGAAAREGLLG